MKEYTLHEKLEWKFGCGCNDKALFSSMNPCGIDEPHLHKTVTIQEIHDFIMDEIKISMEKKQ